MIAVLRRRRELARTAARSADDGFAAGSVELVRHRLLLWRNGGEFTVDARRGRPVPEGSRYTRVAGPDPIRVLLVGGDYAVGVGAATRSVALDGAIAELANSRTGRGVTVENRSQDHIRLRDLEGSMGAAGAHTFDLVIWAPTFGEAARYFTLRPWREGLTTLIQAVQSSSTARVVLLNLPTLLGSQPLAAVARWRAAQVGHVLEQVVARHSRTFLVTPPAIDLRELSTVSPSEIYSVIAMQVLDVLQDDERARVQAMADEAELTH